MTREDFIERARSLYEALHALCPEAAEDARKQAGLPEVWIWSSMTRDDAHRLAVTCQVRLLGDS